MGYQACHVAKSCENTLCALRSEGKLPAWCKLDFPLVWERVKLLGEFQENMMKLTFTIGLLSPKQGQSQWPPYPTSGHQTGPGCRGCVWLWLQRWERAASLVFSIWVRGQSNSNSHLQLSEAYVTCVGFMNRTLELGVSLRKQIGFPHCFTFCQQDLIHLSLKLMGMVFPHSGWKIGCLWPSARKHWKNDGQKWPSFQQDWLHLCECI